MSGNIYFMGDEIMWIKTIGGKLLNMNSVCLVDINTPILDNDRWHVTAYLAGETDSLVTIFIGSLDDCNEYMQKLGDKLSVQQVEVVRPEDIAKIAW